MPDASKKERGRPPKFRGPRRPVTVTLPEDTLAQLAAIDSDRAQAIVKATAAAAPLDADPHKGVELVEVLPGLGIIVVRSSQYLRRIKWLRIVEVAPTRFLLVIPSGTSVDSLEVAILDLLEKVERHESQERSFLERLRDLLRTLPRGGRLSKAELLLIATKRCV